MRIVGEDRDVKVMQSSTAIESDGPLPGHKAEPHQSLCIFSVIITCNCNAGPTSKIFP